MSSEPPPVPPESDYRRSWQDWLPWALFGLAVAALIGVGIWQGVRIQSLEDDRSSLEAQLSGQEQQDQSVSEQAKKAESNASQLQGTVSKQGDSINSLQSQLASTKSQLESTESQLSTDESANQQLKSGLARTKRQLESAEATAAEVAECHMAIQAGAALNTDVTKAVGELEGAIRADAGSAAERRGLAATLRLLENAESTWAKVSSQVSDCS